MNTKSFLQQARARRLSPETLQAFVLWSLISQSGRPPMTVGEIAKLVALMSGIKPSPYQVRSICERLHKSDTVHRYNLRKTGVALVAGYTSGENGLLMLSAFVHEFIDNKELWDAINNAVNPIRRAAIKVSNDIYHYNQTIDEKVTLSETDVHHD